MPTTFPAEIRAGSVAAIPLPLGGYGACQVVSVAPDSVLVHLLDWYSAEVPTLAQLAGAGPLRLDHHAHNGRPDGVGVFAHHPVPFDFAWLGTQPIRPEVPPTSNGYTGWSYLPDQVVRQRRWARLPAATKAAYRAGASRGPVRVDLGGQPAELGAGLGRLDLTRSPLVPASGDVRWAGLDALPRCTTLFWSGPDRGLSDFLATRPMFSCLSWRNAPPEVDLGDSGLTDLTLSGSDLRAVRLPPGLLGLTLIGDLPGSVLASERGRWLNLTLEVPPVPVPIPDGLRGVRRLVLRGDGEILAAPVEVLTELETLSIWWRKPPGRLVEPNALTSLHRLHSLQLDDGYGYDAATLPDLPGLRWLEVDGLPRSVVAPLKARYRNTGVSLTVRGAKSDTWLAANIGNPFRDWVDDDPRGGAAACKAYAAALRAVDRLPADAPGRSGTVQQILKTLIDALNRIDEKYEFIDTVNREQAGDAFVDLARRAGVPANQAENWFDRWRDF
ncbi:hypothetical protein I0C86_37575 [Plantactinospora sp. S1510]|uniref:Gliding motility protein n=1 Tax=Plantactinospora alkalitolerans TaxID=2789879 RepID=A0ABS0H808_9ACTN|nr:hypothetical protein [Plantactinospora alkalitolerans]MBF9134600.1 hypothetical protein [Plantactinospora alkalitolerans]